jgi:tetratricopeptide (TPR) repeat protein
MNIRRQLVTLAAAIVLFHAGVGLRSQGFDYVLDEEEDLIRDAQGLQLRVPLFLRLLDNRIVALGLRERTAKEREQVKKDIEKYEREVKEAKLVKDAEVRARPLNPDVYLRKATKSELLRGYMQIVDEIMSNIDDAYDRKLPVREEVEALEKFLNEQLPRLAKFEPSTSAETSSIKSAISHSEEAIEDCRKALKTLPKNLKTAPPPKE